MLLKNTPSVSGTCMSASWLSSVLGTSVSGTSISGRLPPSRGHPSLAAFLHLGPPSSVSGTTVLGYLPPSRGRPSRRHPSPRLAGPRRMAQKDSPGTKSHENGGPFRPGFSSQGHPSAPPVLAFRLGDIHLGVIRLGHIRLGLFRLGDSLQVKSR